MRLSHIFHYIAQLKRSPCLYLDSSLHFLNQCVKTGQSEENNYIYYWEKITAIHVNCDFFDFTWKKRVL